MDCSMPGLPVHHQLLEFTQTHVHWVGDAIQPSDPVIPFSSHLQPFPASGSFPMSQLSMLGGQGIRVSALASVLPMNIQDWFPLRWTGWISLQSKGLFFCFLIFIFTIFYFTILYWYCRTLTWICYGCKWVPNPEPPSNLPPHIISLDHPRAPAYTPRDS